MESRLSQPNENHEVSPEGAERSLLQFNTETQLRERVKELHCLAQLGRLFDRELTLEELLQEAVALLPPAFLFSEDAVARITLGEQVYQTDEFDGCLRTLSSELTQDDLQGKVEVGYRVDRPFLSEEHELVQMVRDRIQNIILRARSKEALKESERRYRLLTDNCLDAIWAVDSDLIFTYINAAVTRITGYTPQEYIGSRFQDRCSRTAMQTVEEAARQALLAAHGKELATCEFDVRHRDGYLVPVEIHARVLYDDEGTAVGFQGTARDIRERRKTLAALRESEEQYRTMFETMAQGAVLYNAKGEMIAVNAAAQRILGRSFEELKNRTSDDPIWRAIREDGTPFPGAEHPAMIALHTGQKSNDTVMGVFNPKENDYRWIQVSAAPHFRAPLEKPYQVYCTFEDVTELRRARAERQEADRMKGELLESIRDCFFSLDQDFTVTYLNRAAEEFLQRSREELLGQNMLDAYPESRGSIFEVKYRQAMREGTRLDFETYFEPHGEWYDIRVYPHSHGIAVFFQPITERKKHEQERRDMEQQLRQAQKLEAVGRLAGGVAHDFNNMLSVILGNVELARTAIGADHPANHDLNEIANAALRSATLTRQLLAFARKQTVFPELVDLNVAIQNTLEMLKRLIPEEIHLVWESHPPLPVVKIDPSQVDQILTNLVVNSRDAIDGVGSIEVSTGTLRVSPENDPNPHYPGLQPGLYVTLTVKDDGCGMTAAVKESIFEPFFTTKLDGPGSGLGLSIIHGIVQQNEGRIYVSSSPGEGTVFEILLPAAKQGSTSESEQTASEPESQGKETILVVEDEPSLLRLTSRMLRGLEYEVRTAGSPQEALELCRVHGVMFDLLLTDVVMPQMNGRELYEALARESPGLKCLFMSGYTFDVLANRGGVLSDEVHFLQKPFSRQSLAEKVKEALHSGTSSAQVKSS